MAQSPAGESDIADTGDYLKSWDALSSMIVRGRSFSGHERNRVFLNQGQQPAAAIRRFANVSGATGADLIHDGRGLAATDWDGDGDLDIWMSARTGPRLRFLRNDLQRPGRHLGIRLQGESCNRDAIGARVNVHLERDRNRPPMLLSRTLRAGDSFLSQSGKVLTIGIPDGSRIVRLEVSWPGQASPETFTVAEPDRQVLLVQGSGAAAPVNRPERVVTLTPSVPVTPPIEEKARIVFFDRPALPAIPYVDFSGELRSFKRSDGRATLVNLWASWCGPCLAELAEFKKQAGQLRDKGIDIVAFSTDAITEDGSKPDLTAARQLVATGQYPFETGMVEANTVRLLTLVQNLKVSRERPLPLPSSFLVDADGKVAILYKGPVEVAQLLQDANLPGASAQVAREAAFPFPGKNGLELFELSALTFAQAFQAGGYTDDARAVITAFIATATAEVDAEAGASASPALLKACYFLGTLEQSQRNWEAAAAAYLKVLDLSPDQVSVRLPLAVVLWEAGDREEAERHFEKAGELGARSAALLDALGKSYLQTGRPGLAVAAFTRALALSPESIALAMTRAAAEMRAGDTASALQHYKDLLAAHPGSLEVMNAAAWVFATHPDEQARNAAEAVRLAELVCQQTGHGNAAPLDTLAAAYANTGRFDEAVAAGRKALALLAPRASGRSPKEQALRKRIAAYEAGQPWRESAGEQPPPAP